MRFSPNGSWKTPSDALWPSPASPGGDRHFALIFTEFDEIDFLPTLQNALIDEAPFMEPDFGFRTTLPDEGTFLAATTLPLLVFTWHDAPGVAAISMRDALVTFAAAFGWPAGGAGDRIRTAPALFFRDRVIVVSEAIARTDRATTRDAETDALCELAPGC